MYSTSRVLSARYRIVPPDSVVLKAAAWHEMSRGII
jgi:hypothetical protein